MRLFFFFALITLFLSGCETASTHTSSHTAVHTTNLPMTPSSQQNTNPNVTAGKMLSPMM